MTGDAHSRLREICVGALEQVDLDRSKFVDMQQSKAALLYVFQQLKGELPQPYEYWFELVFRNFDRDRDGLIHSNDIQEIVIQYYDHYHARLEKTQSKGSNDTQQGTIVSSVPHDTSSEPVSDPSIHPPVPAAMQHYASSVNRATAAGVSLPYSPPPQDASTPSDPNQPMINPDLYKENVAIYDDYEFFDKAGQGAFGKVLVVRHKTTKQVRACKAVSFRGQSQADLIQTEIRLLRRLDHPNILKLFDTYFDGVTIYMVSELCEGGSLQDRLDFHYPRTKSSGSTPPRQPMSEGLVALIMQQILAAIAVCHSHRIIHRDVKPDNILFVTRAKESPLKLIDFGLATTVDHAKSSARELRIKRKGFLGSLSKSLPACVGACVKPYSVRKIMPRAGTLNYFSPEMIHGEYYEQTDVFSVGIIMYQLLTGVHPFYIPGVDDEGSVKFKISKRDADFPFDLWNQISADAKELTRRLLARDPHERISAGLALRHRWFKDPLKPTVHGNPGGVGMVTQSLFEGLKEYSQSTRLKQILLRILARELTEIQTQELRKKFFSLDKSGDGKITREELVNGMKAIGISPADIDALLPSRSNEISYNEFLAALSEKKVKYGKTQLKEAFKKFDTTSAGYITLESLRQMLVATQQSMNDFTISEILAEAGIDESLFSDNTGLTFSDFSDLVTLGYVTRASRTPDPQLSYTAPSPSAPPVFFRNKKF
jgi:calcium-dependent protein kinase